MDRQTSNELDLNNSIDHHPSPDNNSSSSADVTKHDSMVPMLHYQQKHAMPERTTHLSDEGQHSKIACSTSLLNEKLIEEGWLLFIQAN